jgi:AraC-like DNA-binding protein
MTPKHYQRILRIKKVICFLLLHRNVNLADVAQQLGFSDQAPMTR